MERALPRRGQKCYTEPKPSRRQRAPGDQEELMLTFNHFNFNVADLDKSLAFYKEALGLEPVGERKAAADGSFIIVCICFENPAMGIYFVTDPDGYWIEIIPTR